MSQDRIGRLRTFYLEAQDILRLHVLLVDVVVHGERVIAPFSSRGIELPAELPFPWLLCQGRSLMVRILMAMSWNMEALHQY